MHDGFIVEKVLLSAVIIPVATQTRPSLISELIWLGITVPNWVGWVFFISALVFGSLLSTFQDTTVDTYISNRKLKPLYAFGFGLFFTLFGIPLYWSNVTVWELVLPAVISTAVGAQMVYYMIRSGKFILDELFRRVGLTPIEIKDINKEDNQ